MRKILLLVLMAFCVTFSALAQEMTVTGTVKDDTGETLPGATVLIKGTTKGTTTDIDGKYSIRVSNAATVLVYSFAGMGSTEETVGNRTVIDATLTSSTVLTEVVVTALGTTQNAKSVTYANQTVKAEDLLTTPSKNALEALRGKTAGVKITGSSGSVGSSSRIVLRGEASLTGNNNALIVVDGVPIDNGNVRGGDGGGESGYADFGNRFNDIDPNNIASVSILKGPSATSLYGSRGASGVVLITTKSGASGGMKVNLNSTASVERAYILMERQDRWGQGFINDDGSISRDTGENWSWGPEFDGVVRPWTSPVDINGDGNLQFLSRPDVAVDNQLQDFFRTGTTFQNNISISGGNDMIQYYSSYGNTQQDGILDNTDYERHNFTFNTNAKLSDKVKSTFKINYSNVEQNTAQEGSRAFEGQNAYAAAVQAPNTVPYNELRDYNSPYHDFQGYYGSYTTNPYFILNEFVNQAKINNILASASISYNPIENLTLQARGGVNNVTIDRFVVVPAYAYENHLVWGDNLSLTNREDRQESIGSVDQAFINNRVIDWTTSATYDWKINDDFTLSSVIGLNYYDVNNKQLTGSTVNGLVIPDLYSLSSSVENAQVIPSQGRRRIIGLFGNLALDWKDKIFLNYSARNDWSSTLPKDSQSFDYHAVGLSAIVTELVDMDNTPIDYLKVRASVGTTGKDAGIYLLNSTFNVNPTFFERGDFKTNSPFNGQTGISRGSLIGNNTLRPELTTSYELGFDVELAKGRITSSYTYYNNLHSDQIVEVSLSAATGFSRTAQNVGEITNKGHEVTLGLIPVFTGGFKWKMDLTWARNVNEVVKISDEVDELTIYSSGRGVTLVAEEGKPFGTWKSSVPSFTPDGRPIVDGVEGLPVLTDDIQAIGNVQPDWIGGLVNTFSYKGISITAVFDTRQGGEIYSLSQAATEFNGTALTTTDNNRQNYVIPNSVVQNEDGTFSENTVALKIQDYYTNGDDHGRYVFDGSFLKFRELSLGYSIPRKALSGLNIKGASVNLFMKNVVFWLPGVNTFADPEVNGPSSTTSNITGVETTQTPPSRSFGINLNITL